MRNCPHCGKEIQDEAAFCRFCRRDVEPPLWLTSLQKCPYCAEWVERGIERCPLCGKVLITEETVFVDEEADSTEILLREVRENIFSKDSLNTDDLDEEPRDPSPFHAIRQDDVYSTDDPFESQEGLGVLRERQRERFVLEDEDKPLERQKVAVERRPVNLPIARILPWFLLITATIVVVIVAFIAFQRLDPLTSLGLLAQNPSQTQPPDPSPTPSMVPDVTPSPTIGAALLPPLPTEIGAPGECKLWSEITPEMEGQTICAYGEIKRRFRVDSEIPYMAIFSEDQGTFAIVDRLTFYTQFLPGDCIRILGEVEVMRGARPFIDAQNDLALCPADG